MPVDGPVQSHEGRGMLVPDHTVVADGLILRYRTGSIRQESRFASLLTTLRMRLIEKRFAMADVFFSRRASVIYRSLRMVDMKRT